jgi:hypothetical protein
LGEGDVAEPKRQSVEVGGEAKQVDPAAVGLGVAAGGVEFAPENSSAPERIAGQGSVELTNGDSRPLSAVTISPETNSPVLLLALIFYSEHHTRQ